MSAKHTPLPWSRCQNRIEDAEGNTIATIDYTQSGYVQANLALFHAAPDLLEACEQCAEWLDLVKQNYPDMAGLIRGMEQARAAIAKAREE